MAHGRTRERSTERQRRDSVAVASRQSRSDFYCYRSGASENNASSSSYSRGRRERYERQQWGRPSSDPVATGGKRTTNITNTQTPSVSRCGIVISNLPKKVKQYELEALFAPVPGTVAVSLMNSVYGGHVKDGELASVAFLLMSSTETATALMNSDWKHSAYCRDQKMELEYAELGLQNRMMKELFPTHCWICASCGVDNIPKREYCFSCHALRSLSCGYVDPTVPTRVVRVAHVDTRMSESEIETMIKAAAPVYDIKFSRDLKTGKHKGSFHCYFYSVEDAKKIIDMLKETLLVQEGHALCIEYCMEKKGYAPEKKRDTQQSILDTVTEGFELDPISGHYLVEKSTGLYYDPNSGYFYDPNIQVWGTKDPVSGTFVPYISSCGSYSIPQEEDNGGGVIHRDNNTNKNNAQQGNSSPPEPSIQGVIHKGTWARKQNN